MAAPKGHPRYGGRKKGTVNKITADVKALARIHGADAVSVLANLMKQADSDQAKISAAKELLDRGYGKATQILAGDEEAPLRMITGIKLIGPD